MAELKVPGIIGGAWVSDVSKAMVTIPGWAQAFNEGQASAGTAYTISPWANRCISIRAQALSKMPWEIQQNGQSLPESEMADTLEDSKIKDLLRLGELDLCITGRAFWEKAFAGNHLVGLRRLNAKTMQLHKTPDGIDYFEQNLQGKPRRFSPEQIFYVHEFDPDDDLDGIALSKIAELAINTEHNADRYLASFFKNSARPDIVFVTDADLPKPEADKAEAWWKRMFGGVGNAFRAGFLGRGLKPNILSFPLNELALTEIRGEARRSICATFGVPPTVANAADPGSYATADEQRQSLYEETIIPRGEWWAEQINDQIIHNYRTDMDFRFKVEDLETIQEDENRKAERMGLLVEKGIITEQTAGAELGYSPEEIGKGRQEPAQFPGLGGFGQPPNPRPLTNPQAPKLFQKYPPLQKAEESGGLLEDLKRWRKKASRMAKAGKSAVVDFSSAAIAPNLIAAIQGQLETAKTVKDVHGVFDRVEHDLPGRGMSVAQ